MSIKQQPYRVHARNWDHWQNVWNGYHQTFILCMVLSVGPYSLDKQKMFVNYTKLYTIDCTDVYLLFKKKLDSLLQHWQWLLAMLDTHVQHWGQEESFPCPFGLFQLKGMTFGINNVPSTLQKVMDVTIGDLRGWICIFCLDDKTDTIYIFFPSRLYWT